MRLKLIVLIVGALTIIYPNYFAMQFDFRIQVTRLPAIIELSDSMPSGIHILITEVYYNALVENEYVVITNQGESDNDISNWTLSDNEGILAFPPNTVLQKGGYAVIAQNSSLYTRDTLELAQFRFNDGDAPSMIRKYGTFQLRNDGDEVLLSDAYGELVDVFIYGISSYKGPGWEGEPAIALTKGHVAHRIENGGRFQDTNSSSDWNQIRTYVLGHSHHEPRTFEFNGIGHAFVSPDGSFDAFSRIVETARISLLLNAYKFTSSSLKQQLLEALERGVNIRIFAEGGPVGGIDEVEHNALMDLRMAGAQVRFLQGNSELRTKARYNYNHAKYLVADNANVLVTSENFGESGFPCDGTIGNRGWGIWLENSEIASFVSNVFLEDWEPMRMDSVDILDADISIVTGSHEEYPTRFLPPIKKEPIGGLFRVTPVVGPDNTLHPDTVVGLIRSAKTSLHIEQFYIDTSWENYPNLYLLEAIEAARRGVTVRVLLDASDYNVDNATLGNDDTVEYLNELAVMEGLPLQAKLGMSDSHQLIKFHNKGLVVDREKVLISSINWNLNSVTQNRELGFIVENKEIASFFDDVFRYDWKDDVTPPIADAGNDIFVVQETEVHLSASGSRDDSGIASYLWDIDGDGVFELTGMVISLRFSNPGSILVVLRIEDYWNNTAFAFVNVTVIKSPEPPLTSESWPAIQILACILFLIAIPIVIFIILRRKQ